MANNIVATWGFKRKLRNHLRIIRTMQSLMTLPPNTVLGPKKSTLHAATLRAVAYLELENPVGSTPPEKLGAVGTQSNNFVVAEYPSKTGDLRVVVYNQLNGKFYGGCYTPSAGCGKHTGKIRIQRLQTVRCGSAVRTDAGFSGR